MAAAMKGIITMEEAFAAVAWVTTHGARAGGAVQQPPSFARAAATKNVSVGGAMGETGKRRAKNVFQGAGKIKCTDWARAVKTCQDEWEGCVPCSGLPAGFPKDRPKRLKGMERLEWRATVDDFSLALMESFGHRELVKSKNPDHAIRTSVWTCGECTLQMRTNLTLEGAWASLQVQGVTQGKVDENSVQHNLCAAASTHMQNSHMPNSHVQTSHVPNSLVPRTHASHTLLTLAQVRR